MSLVFSLGVVGWLSLGGACATVATLFIAFVFAGRGPVQRTLDVIAVAIGAWTIVASRSFGGDTLRWLSFSGAAAIFGLAMVGLIGHEVLLERELARLEGGARTHARAPVQLRPPHTEPARAGARQTA